MIKKISVYITLIFFYASLCLSADINTLLPPINPIGAKIFAKSSGGSVGWVKSVDTVVPVVGVSPEADTASINAALLGGNKHVLITNDATISGNLVIYSNTFLEVSPGATITQPDGNSTKLLVNKAYFDGTGRDENIKVSGKFVRGTSTGGTGADKHSISLHYIDGLDVVDVEINTTSGNKYAISISDVTNLKVERIKGTTVSDLVHLIGPINNATIRDVHGVTGDDCVGVTATDYSGYSPTYGDITNLTIENIYANTTHSIVKVIGGTGGVVKNVSIKDIRGAANIGVNLMYDPLCGLSDISGVSVDGVWIDMTLYPTGRVVSATTTTGKTLSLKNLFAINNLQVGQLIVDLHTWGSVSAEGMTSDSGLGSIIRVQSGGVVGGLQVSNINLSNSSTILFDIAGSVNAIVASNLVGNYTDTTNGRIFNLSGSAVVGKITGENITMYKGRSPIDLASGAILERISLSNIILDGTNRLANAAANLNLVLNSFTGNLVNAAIYVSNSAAVNLWGAGVRRYSAFNGFQRAGSEVIHCMNRDFPADLSLLTGSAGDECLATAGTLTPATLPARVVHNGTAWKSLLNLP